MTSATSNTIGTGSKTFTVNLDSTASAIGVGTVIRAVFDASNLMAGVVTAYSGTTLTINSQASIGSGTYTAWTFVVIGSQGATGPTGPTGPIGFTGSSGSAGTSNDAIVFSIALGGS
jgi:hypothetical protein